MRTWLVVLLLCLFSLPAVSQAIYVDHHGDDTVGTAFLFHFKQAIQSAKGYKLLATKDDTALYVDVNLVTVDAYVDGVQLQSARGSASYVSYVVTLQFPVENCSKPTRGELMLQHSMKLVGSQRSGQAADDLLAEIDKIMDILTKGLAPKAASAQ